LCDTQNVVYTNKEWDRFATSYPSLAFSAPEIVNNPSKCCLESDIFSLAILICVAYKCKVEKSTKDYLILNPTDQWSYQT